MLLEQKVSVIYGAGGPIGAAIARAFASEGARVFLAGRTREKLDRVAEEIRGAGGTAEVTVVDALDGGAVDEYADAVAEQAGGIDVSVNVIGVGDVQQPPGGEEIAASLQEATLLNRTATLADVGSVAAFVASDKARTMTSTDVNISCGAIVD